MIQASFSILNLGGMKLNKNEEIYIDDTPMDLSNVEPLSDEEYEKYWERRKKEIEKETNK